MKKYLFLFLIFLCSCQSFSSLTNIVSELNPFQNPEAEGEVASNNQSNVYNNPYYQQNMQQNVQNNPYYQQNMQQNFQQALQPQLQQAVQNNVNFQQSQNLGVNNYGKVQQINNFYSKPKINKGDVLEIIAKYPIELSQNIFTVGDSGFIDLGLVGEINVINKNVNELHKNIEKRLSNYYKIVDFKINHYPTKNTDKVYENIILRNEEGGSKSIDYAENQRIYNVLVAGDINLLSLSNNSMLIRKGKQYKLRLYDLFTKNDLSQNIIVHPGDIIILRNKLF